MNRPLLIVVEGANDLEFLVRLTSRLRCELPALPDLESWREAGRVILLPVGGGDSATWPDRLRMLGLPEFHLYDREQQPETDLRRQVVERINARADCRGFLTAKRSLENYLHPAAIASAGGGELSFGNDDPVSLLLAQRWYETQLESLPWEFLTRRTQRRLSARAKRWLNTAAVNHMTSQLLAERDPASEVLGWLRTIEELVLQGARPS